MPKKFRIVKPRLMLSKHGKLGLRGPLFRLGGFNFSRTGISYSQRVGRATLNTRTGLSLPLASLISSVGSSSEPPSESPQLVMQEKKPGLPVWAIILGGLVGLTFCCMIIVFGAAIIGGDSTPTPSPEPVQRLATVELATEIPIEIPTEIPTEISTETEAPTQTIFPTQTSLPAQTSSAQVCSCEGDTMNCPDFGSSTDAQACFDYCVSEGRGDVHGLDGDGNGLACENP